ncbi:MAG: HAMP domain-containing protein [Prevotella sp.]|nr:HAMP domain-containing protein [Prevotella sp.]
MQKWANQISRTLSFRLSLMVVLAVAILLSLSLAVLFHFSRQALKQEALQSAEQTLESTVQHIDNILLSVEQSVGNIYWDMLVHLDDPEQMKAYSKRIADCNPYILNCDIVLHPDSVVPAGKVWTGWSREKTAIFSLPIYNRRGQCIGQVDSHVSIALISQIILSSKPSPNGYSTLLDSKGSYIVHPDSDKLLHQTIYTQTEGGKNASIKEVADAMVAGETGYKRFTMDGHKNYVFYKPFLRSDVPGRTGVKLDWSVGVIYPENDIFGEYNQLLYYVLGIAVVSLLLFFALCWLIAHRQLLPLQMLTKSAQRIAEGNYKEPISPAKDTSATHRREDEIGLLQECFQQMQQSLSVHVSELEQLLKTLEEHGESLRKMYRQAQEADHMKIAFLHNMTNQMMDPAKAIAASVERLCQSESEERTADYRDRCAQEVDTIKSQSKVITDVLNQLLDAADSEKGKEEPHE